MPACSPSVLTMVPMSREQNSPCAMAPMASMPYRLAERTMFFRLRNAVIFSILMYLLYQSDICHDICLSYCSPFSRFVKPFLAIREKRVYNGAKILQEDCCS